MSADADHWWRNRREASVNSADAWSGGGRAYRRWMGAEPARDGPVPAQASSADAAAGAAERPGPPNPNAAARWTQSAWRGRRRWRPPALAADRPGPPNPRAAVRFSRAPRSMRTRGLRNAALSPYPVAGVLLSILTGIPLAWWGIGKRFRVSLGLGAAGLAAVVSLAPLAWAGRLDPCAAAEVALVEKAISLDGVLAANKVRVANWTGPDGRPLSHGRVGRQIAAEEHAGWPAAAGCTALFWRARWEVASFGGLTPVLTRALAVRR